MRFLLLGLGVALGTTAFGHGWVDADQKIVIVYEADTGNADRLLDLFEDLGHAMGESDDCSGWARSVENWTTQSVWAVKGMRALGQRELAGMRYRDRVRYERRLRPIMEVITETYAPCADQEDAHRAMESLDGLILKPAPPSL